MRSRIIAVIGAVAVAFLLATNPVVADAAKQITGKNIKNNTVTTKDIKNKTLKLTDIHKSAQSALKNKTYDFNLPSTAASTEKTFTFPVPAGTYLVAYSVISVAATPPACYLQSANTVFPVQAFSYGTDGGGTGTTQSSAVLQVGNGQVPELTCFGASFTIYNFGDAESSVSFTRLDSVGSSNSGGGRPAPQDNRPNGGVTGS